MNKKILWAMAMTYPRSKKNFSYLVSNLSDFKDCLVIGKRQKEYYKSLKIFDNVFDLVENFKLYPKHNINELKLSKSLSQSVYKYIEYDRQLNNKNIDTINQIIFHHHDYIQKLLEKNNYNYFYGEIGHFHSKLLQEIGLKYGVKILWPQTSFWSDRFFLVTEMNTHMLKV